MERLRRNYRYFCCHHLATELISGLWDVHLKDLVWFLCSLFVFFDSKEPVSALGQNEAFLVVWYRKNTLYLTCGLKLVMTLYHSAWGFGSLNRKNRWGKRRRRWLNHFPVQYISKRRRVCNWRQGYPTFRHEEWKDQNPTGLRKAAKEHQALLYSLSWFCKVICCCFQTLCVPILLSQWAAPIESVPLWCVWDRFVYNINKLRCKDLSVAHLQVAIPQWKAVKIKPAAPTSKQNLD